jgi:two-component system, OmpR family, alkaline phosphatase synthesis response regulator PhoP
MKHERIVVIEDEADIQEVIEHNLTREGFQVYASSDGENGLQLVKKESPNLVLLDLMLPGLDGLEVCRELKADPLTRAIPVIMVTAKGEESDIVLGLGIGADDYVAKPFSPKELVARVKSVLRRGQLQENQNDRERIVFGDLVIDAGRHEILVEGEPVVFTATELRLLQFLASHPGRVFTRDHLLSRVIGVEAVVVDRNIDVHIRSIRKKLGNHRDLVETIRGVGYRFRDDQEYK